MEKFWEYNCIKRFFLKNYDNPLFYGFSKTENLFCKIKLYKSKYHIFFTKKGKDGICFIKLNSNQDQLKIAKKFPKMI